MGSDLLVERRGAILDLTLNRPDKHNAFHGEMIAQLIAALEQARQDRALRVVVLRANGKNFCAGADLKWMKSLSGSGSDHSMMLARFFQIINDSPVPVIARVQGAVRGGGVGVVSCCDIPLAKRSANFALTEVRLGLAPAVISPFVISKIGVAAARELFVTGARFEAERAHRLGLINHLYDSDDEIDEAIEQFASRIIKGGPTAVAASKNLALTVHRLDPESALSTTMELIARLRSSAEGQEGMQAFLEKRPPSWVTDAGELE